MTYLLWQIGRTPLHATSGPKISHRLWDCPTSRCLELHRKKYQLIPSHSAWILHSQSDTTPRGFLLQPPDSGWSPRCFCWFDTWEWRTPSSFFPPPRGAAMIPNYCGLDWSGAKSGLRPKWFPNCWSLLAAHACLHSQLLLGGHLRRQTETQVCKVIYWAQAGKNERHFLSWASNYGITGTKYKFWLAVGEWPAQSGLWAFTVSCPTPSSEMESAKAAWNLPFFTRVSHSWPKKEICQNNNSAILWCFWVFTLLPWERTRLSLNSSLAVL